MPTLYRFSSFTVSAFAVFIFIFALHSALATTSTFYPDPNTEVSSVDGYVAHHDENTGSWSNLRNAAGNAAADSAATDYAVFHQWWSGCSCDWWLTRGVFLFDTSTLGEYARVTSATLSLWPTTVYDDYGDFKFNITSATPASNIALASSDYATSSFGSTRFVAADVDLTGLSTGAYYAMTLNAAGTSSINVTGLSRFGVRFDRDLDNNDPTNPGATSNAGFQASMADTSSTSQDPKLEVVYTFPQKVRQTSSRSVSTTTLTLASSFGVGLESGTAYIVDAAVLVEASSSVPDLKIRFSAPSGSVVDLGYIAGTSSQGVLSNDQTSSTIDLAANTPTIIHVSGTVKTSSTSGTLDFYWAQASASADYVTVLKGSYLRADSL